MNTAQILYEQYKVLPQDIKAELRQLIEAEPACACAEAAPSNAADTDDEDDDDSGDTIMISAEALRVSIEQVQLLRQGKAELSTLEELFASLKDE